LKDGRLACSVRPDQAKDLAVRDFEIDAANSLNRAVVLFEPGDPNRTVAVCSFIVGGGCSFMCLQRCLILRCGRHWSPCTRISPSPAMPGLANPIAPLSCSLTPTTCFTRSSLKYVFSGVKVASGSTRDTNASIGSFGFESR